MSNPGRSYWPRRDDGTITPVTGRPRRLIGVRPYVAVMTDGRGPGTTPPDSGNSTGSGGESGREPYSGVVGAFPYALRTTPSLGMKLYVLVSLLLSGVVVLVFALALVALVGGTAGAQGGTLTFSRAFFVLIMVGVIGPLIAPVLLVARRHRRTGSTRRYDAAIAAAGFVFVLAVYAGLVISTPVEQQTTAAGLAGSVLRTLYGLPRLAGFGPPAAAIGLLWLVHRRFGEDSPRSRADGRTVE